MGRSRLLLALLGALFAVASLWITGRSRAPAPLNVVVVTLDTTRADRLSPYGFMNVTLPHLERLAREGVVFDQATTVAPLTLPAHTSLFTGLLPPRHGVHDNADPPLGEAATTLAETLHARGYRTGAFVGSVVLDPDRGLQQGFDEYRSVAPSDQVGPARRQRRAEAVINDAMHWLDAARDAPFFLWVHLYDAHRPYDPPEPFASTYGHNPYVGEIAYADDQLGRLLGALERGRRIDDTVVVIAGDHGESLGERGEQDHGILIYENILRVPLIIRARRIPPGRIGEVVRLTDVTPTILDLLAVQAPTTTDGVSLVPLMRGHARNLDLEAYAESLYPERFGLSSLRSLRVGRYKLIDGPRPELFDLQQDPFEEANIFETRHPLAATMAARIAALSETSNGGSASVDRAVPKDVQDRMAALGYVARARSAPPKDRSRLLDPRDCLKSATRCGLPR